MWRDDLSVRIYGVFRDAVVHEHDSGAARGEAQETFEHRTEHSAENAHDRTPDPPPQSREHTATLHLHLPEPAMRSALRTGPRGRSIKDQD